VIPIILLAVICKCFKIGVLFVSLLLYVHLVRYYICKIFGNLHQKGTFLVILVGKNLNNFHAPSTITMVGPIRYYIFLTLLFEK